MTAPLMPQGAPCWLVRRGPAEAREYLCSVAGPRCAVTVWTPDRAEALRLHTKADALVFAEMIAARDGIEVAVFPTEPEEA